MSLVVVVIARRLLLSSVIQAEEVCDRGRIIPQILHCELRRVALAVKQMLYGVRCHSTLQTNIWYATGDAGLVTVQRADSDRNAAGQEWYGLTEGADFQEVRYLLYNMTFFIRLYITYFYNLHTLYTCTHKYHFNVCTQKCHSHTVQVHEKCHIIHVYTEISLYSWTPVQHFSVWI